MSGTLVTQGMLGSDLRTTLNVTITDSSLSESRRKWYGKKMVVFGDSIWTQNTIQPELIRLLGTTYNETEMTTGTNGFKPTAVPGTGICTPSTVGASDNMYMRARDVYHYSPAIIFIEGGINDTLSGTYGPVSYNHYDGPYLGDDIVTDGSSYVSGLKGMFKTLIQTNPTAKIIFTGRYWYQQSDYDTSLNTQRAMARQAADEFCCRWAGVTYIDPLKLGISVYNVSTYMSSGAHPNAAGGVLIAHAFANAATMI